MATGGLRTPLYDTSSPRGASLSINSGLMLTRSQVPDHHGSPTPAMPLVGHSPMDGVQFGSYSQPYQAERFPYSSPLLQSRSRMSLHSSPGFPYSQTSTSPCLPGVDQLERDPMSTFSTGSAREPWQGHTEATMGGYDGRATEASRVSDYSSQHLHHFDHGAPIVSQGPHEYGAGSQGRAPEVDGNQDM